MNDFSILAPAKINLYLDVLDKRPDGYHNIKTVMQTISIYDEISLSVFCSEKYDNEIEISSNDSSILWDSSNLVYKSASAYLKSADIHNKKLFFYVKKEIPICAGMAGGSADAAGVLLLLNEAFSQFSETELCKIGATLGADIPFCITKGTCLCEGIGEKITKLRSLENVNIVCALGDEPKVSTPYAYSMLDKLDINPDSDGNAEKMMLAITNSDINGIASLLYNKFEAVATSDVDKIKSILTASGAIGTIMSGSGPSVFGIFNTKVDAEKAFLALKNAKFKAFLCKTV